MSLLDTVLSDKPTAPGIGLTTDPVLGNIQIYREYFPMRDEIEYTVFWRDDEKKHRVDFIVKAEEMEGSVYGDVEGFIRNRMYNEVDKYKAARRAEALGGIELVNEVKVDLIHHNLSDNMIAMAAWVSHDADSETRLEDQDKVKGLINFLVRNKHLSPLEHGSLTVKSNVPLFVRSEWHRHRTQSYNEVSGRYTEMMPRFWCGTKARVQKGKPGDYYFVEGTPEQTAGYLKSKERAVKSAWEEYRYRLELGIAKEQAREDLPLSLMTEFYATGNLRNWFQFLALRDESHALEEIQMAAKQVAEIVEKAAPFAYAAFKEYGV